MLRGADRRTATGRAARSVSGAGASPTARAFTLRTCGARRYAVRRPMSREMTKLSFPCHLQVIRVRVGSAAMQILVIEDEPRILAFLAHGLEAEGFPRGRRAGMGPTA